jgi:hypothetical protein
VIIIGFLLIGPADTTWAAAQIFPTEAEWYYGYRLTPGDEPDSFVADSYDLIAYNLDGEMVPVVEGMSDIPRLLFALTANHALVASEENEQPIYYDVEETEAIPLEIAVENEPDDLAAYLLISYRAPYALLSTGQMGTRLIIADLENDTLQLTDHGALYSFESCCVLTEDGTLQYFARVDEGNTTFALIERDLAAGEERILFSDPQLQIGAANRSGDRWLFQISVRDTREKLYVIWQGDTEVRRETVELQERFTWVGDYLYRDDALCEQNCEIILESPDGEITTITTTYPDAGEGTARLFFPGMLLEDGSLIGQLQDPSQLVKITSDGEVETFGFVNFTRLSSNGIGGYSFDGRFTAVVPDVEDTGYAIIDTETGETLIENDAENEARFVSVFFFPRGVLVNAYGDPNVFQYYRASDQQLFELPSETTSYVDVLDDETLFYFARSEEIPTQIGLYDLETGEMQEIVEGIWPVQVRQAIRSA